MLPAFVSMGRFAFAFSLVEMHLKAVLAPARIPVGISNIDDVGTALLFHGLSSDGIVSSHQTKVKRVCGVEGRIVI